MRHNWRNKPQEPEPAWAARWRRLVNGTATYYDRQFERRDRVREWTLTQLQRELITGSARIRSALDRVVVT